MEHIPFRQESQDSRILNQPTSTADSPSEEVVGDTDEPPDRDQSVRMKQINPQFKKVRYEFQRKESLLTQRLHSSESDSQHDDEDIFSGSGRAHSTASTWSRGSAASTAELTSDGHTSPARTRTPSPPLPPVRLPMLAPVFNTKTFSTPATVKIVQDGIDPLRTTTPLSANEDKVEAGLGRKRCIMFACGKREENIKPVEQPAQPAKRPCALTFACPTRAQAPTSTNKPHVRLSSPAPPRRIPQSPKPTFRPHRGSDATVRTTSPKTVRKMPSIVRDRQTSAGSDVDQYEATRFHEFASYEEERDDWTQEATCHRNRLTIDDTLQVENKLRKLATEVDDEDGEEDEEEELDQGLGDEEEDLDDEEDDDNDSIGMVDSTGYVTDEGFQTDDEEGFAGSDDDSDAGSDYAWWAPGHSGGEHVEHIRHTRTRSDSGSSNGSFTSTRVIPSKTPKMIRRKKTHPVDFRPRTPELPDSTDFVCGTLDEDRPLEQAYISCLEQRRAAKHKPVPQDIDPTFPTSDPDMDDQDEDSDEDDIHVDESDHHMFLHGAPDPSDTDMGEPRGIIPKKRSPQHSPKRMRSPPPTKRTAYHSPPPRRMFAQSPKRLRSPPPARLRSPPPTVRRSSFAKQLEDKDATPVAFKGRPRLGRGASSLPRSGAFAHQRLSFQQMVLDDENGDGNEEASSTDNLPTRGAIDIVKGLEKKRQRRHEKMLEKHCRLRNKGNQKKHPHVVLTGRGVERMKEMGMELAALRGKRPIGSPTEHGQHILSY